VLGVCRVSQADPASWTLITPGQIARVTPVQHHPAARYDRLTLKQVAGNHLSPSAAHLRHGRRRLIPDDGATGDQGSHNRPTRERWLRGIHATCQPRRLSRVRPTRSYIEQRPYLDKTRNLAHIELSLYPRSVPHGSPAYRTAATDGAISFDRPPSAIGGILRNSHALGGGSRVPGQSLR
jgi:hypothetical protein